ncbi:hypothetical protein [Kushneria sinocarnis]|nr:hypothetical protein [Kushneria sinocarnis]
MSRSEPPRCTPATGTADPADQASLLQHCAGGDITAFHRLREYELPRMLATARAFMPEPSQCEQVAHDVLALGWKNAWRFTATAGRADAWLWRIFCCRLGNQLQARGDPLPAGAAAAPRGDAFSEAIARHLVQHLADRPAPTDPLAALPELAATLPSETPSHTLLERLDTTIDHLPAQPGDEERPAGETIFRSLSHPSLRRAILQARLQYHFRERFKRLIGRPLEDAWFERWRKGGKTARLEALGLPRRSVEEQLGSRLDLNPAPDELICSVAFPDRAERRRLANRFIWEGDWDQRLKDVNGLRQHRFIADIWQHRLDLTRSDSYQHYLELLQQGRPWRSHHKGVALESPERILGWLRIYHLYMEDMACFGFDAGRGKDRLGVAIDRHGRIVKINKGLHRLAMARVLGLPTLPVRVRGIHRQWWQAQAGGRQGDAALDAVAEALSGCRPAPLTAVETRRRTGT